MVTYCAVCGGSLMDGANFCSACGNAVTNPVHHASGPVRPLIRPRMGRKIAGVCLGLSTYYGWDVSITRLITVLLIVFTFPVALVAYGVCWLVVPEQLSVSPSATSLKTAP